MKGTKGWFGAWITDHLPDRDGDYLVTVMNDIGESKVCSASYEGGHWGTESKVNRLTVTAWTALPESYSESKSYEKGFAAQMADAIVDGLKGDDDDDVL